MSLDPRIPQFEQELDEVFASRPSCRIGGPDTIFSGAHIAEIAYAMKSDVGDDLVNGLQVIAPLAVGRDPVVRVPSEEILEDLRFGAHYWRLRELLYYSYNAPGSINWEFDTDRIQIRYADPSLPRQFFIATNNWFLESRRVFEGCEDPDKIRKLLRGTPETAASPAGRRALALIEDEAATKLSAYFNLFEPDFDAPLEEHSFRQLMEACRLLLAKALWHRYHTEVNDSHGAVLIGLDELAESLTDASDLLDPAAARWALRFMSYGVDSRDRGEDPLYFSLYRLLPDDRVLLLPHHFCTWESFVSLMRLIALRNPVTYLRHFSGAVGSGLTRRVAAAFEGAGFECRTEVSLRRFGTELPDIDLLVISHEPTLGVVVLICEVKAPLPPRWAKDQLRVLRPDSVAKSFGQLKRILAFLKTKQGAGFLRGLLPEEGLAGFDEFAVACFKLVITSDNAGAFFAGRKGAIVDFRTLERLLSRCDGDVLYLISALGQLGEYADKCLGRVEVEVEMGGTRVAYEGITVERLLDFEQAHFRSAGLPQKMAEEMQATGARPLDFLRDQTTRRTRQQLIRREQRK